MVVARAGGGGHGELGTIAVGEGEKVLERDGCDGCTDT